MKGMQRAMLGAKQTLRHDPDWVAKFTADAERYFEATGHPERALRHDLLEAAVAERVKPGTAAKTLDAWRATLSEARNAVTSPVFRDDLDRQLKEEAGARKSQVEQIQHWVKTAGLPLSAWKASDLGGKEHVLGNYRGKVVVLDFWFRQCMRAMPQVEQAAATFRHEQAPVEFLAVSTDEDAADAKFVADTMQLDYPVLRAKKLAEQLGVTLFPTLLVIGPDGTLQGIYLGYSLTLREDLTSCIRRVLMKQQRIGGTLMSCGECGRFSMRAHGGPTRFSWVPLAGALARQCLRFVTSPRMTN
jgi:thiol-disulfide isomerase/thioredoxin